MNAGVSRETGPGPRTAASLQTLSPPEEGEEVQDGGEGGAKGRRLEEGREEAKETTLRGRSQRSNLLSKVGVAGHKNRCWVT
jgi:hypothetical protein